MLYSTFWFRKNAQKFVDGLGGTFEYRIVSTNNVLYIVAKNYTFE